MVTLKEHNNALDEACRDLQYNVLCTCWGAINDIISSSITVNGYPWWEPQGTTWNASINAPLTCHVSPVLVMSVKHGKCKSTYMSSCPSLVTQDLWSSITNVFIQYLTKAQFKCHSLINNWDIKWGKVPQQVALRWFTSKETLSSPGRWHGAKRPEATEKRTRGGSLICTQWHDPCTLKVEVHSSVTIETSPQLLFSPYHINLSSRTTWIMTKVSL